MKVMFFCMLSSFVSILYNNLTVVFTYLYSLHNLYSFVEFSQYHNDGLNTVVKMYEIVWEGARS